MLKYNNMDSLYIYGKHAVHDAVRRRPEVVRAVYATPKVLADQRFRALATRAAHVAILDEARLPREIARDAVHQGTVALIDRSALLHTSQAFFAQYSLQPDTPLVCVAEVTDPQNFGAIIRAAAAFRAAGVFFPRHRQAPLTGAAVKASAGAAFAVPLVEVGNLNRTLRDFTARGITIYGLDAAGDAPLSTQPLAAPAAFVVGSEGKGLREKTRELCTALLSIPIHPRVESLNVATAAAITLHTFQLQR